MTTVTSEATVKGRCGRRVMKGRCGCGRRVRLRHDGRPWTYKVDALIEELVKISRFELGLNGVMRARAKKLETGACPNLKRPGYVQTAR